MATDITLDQGSNEDHLVIEANVVEARAADFELDSLQRRSGRGDVHRRALVHNQGDGLTINYNGDYPAGVRIVAADLNLRTLDQDAGDPSLPAAGQVGDLVLLRNFNQVGEDVVYEAFSLWVCVGSPATQVAGTYWQQLQMRDPVKGTG